MSKQLMRRNSRVVVTPFNNTKNRKTSFVAVDTTVSPTSGKVRPKLRMTEKSPLRPLTPDEKELIQATEEGELDRVRELIHRGVDVNAPNDEDKKGQTALHKAVQHGHHEIADLLLSCGADTRWTDQGYREPWYYAAFSASAPIGAHARMMRLLFRYEKRPTSDLLLLASFSSQPGVMAAILDELGREILSRDSNDWCKFKFTDLHLLDDDNYQCVWPDGSRTARGQTAFGTLVEKAKKQLLTHPSVMALMRWKWVRFGKYFFLTEVFAYAALVCRVPHTRGALLAILLSCTCAALEETIYGM